MDSTNQHPITILNGYKYGREDSVARIAKREGVSRQLVNANRLPALSPTFDEDGYPTDETLKIIETWPLKSNFGISDLLEYVEKAWNYRFPIRKGGRGRESWIYVATVGWSGNESIISALQGNTIFWILCWLESRRGGGYKFLTRPIKE